MGSEAVLTAFRDLLSCSLRTCRPKKWIVPILGTRTLGRLDENVGLPRPRWQWATSESRFIAAFAAPASEHHGAISGGATCRGSRYRLV
jgi:hypothetical protein